jgi:hypothetical protein
MKKFAKKYSVVIIFIGSFILGSGMAYALTSSSFATQAATWATKNCTAALSNSTATATTQQKSIICYNYNKNNEQDTQISSLSTSSNILNNHKVPNLKSISGDLGPFLSSTEFYSPILNRIVQHDEAYLSDNTSTNANYVWFTSGDCSGTGYMRESTKNLQLYLWKAGLGSYWIVNMVHPSQVITPGSFLIYNGNSNSPICSGSSNQSFNVFPATQVSLPFSDPLVLPLSLSY